MFKTKVNDEFWLVTQPDHMELSGYFAAHWGNENFPTLGHTYGDGTEELLRSEIVWAIAQHDAGWWEWEALPQLSETDGLPFGLGEVLKDQPSAMEKWQIGTSRFHDEHPFANILMLHHAINLYKPRLENISEGIVIHPVFWKGAPPISDNDRPGAKSFVDEMLKRQTGLIRRIESDTQTAHWANDDCILMYGRLMQLLDGLAISVCSNVIIPSNGNSGLGFGQDDWDMLNTPRTDLSDLVEIEIRPDGKNSISLDPYPFDLDPLPVLVPFRIMKACTEADRFQTAWNSTLKKHLKLEFRSKF